MLPESLDSIISRPDPEADDRQIDVKVINHCGDEVLEGEIGITMSFRFLDRVANHELSLRTTKACEPFRAALDKMLTEIEADYRDRGLRESGVYLSAIVNARLENLRQTTTAAREEIFRLVEEEKVRLGDNDIDAIRESLKLSLEASFGFLQSDIKTELDNMGLTDEVRRIFDWQMKELLHRESISEVTLRAAVLRRNQQSERKKWWSDRVEKLVWLIVGAAVGIAGTLSSRCVSPVNSTTQQSN